MTRGNSLASQLRELDLSVNKDTLAGLENYTRTLERWNRSINLTALEGGALVRHLVAEPLWVAAQLDPGGRYIDIGSGNGSPAIPWVLAHKFLRADLVESRRRRAVFLRELSRQLDLSVVQIHPVRFNEFLNEMAEGVDWITLQGVRFTTDLWRDVRSVSGPETRIVWMTSDKSHSIVPSQTLKIPGSNRSALVFRI